MKLHTVIEARRMIESLSATEGLNPHLAYWMAKFVMKTESDYSFYSEQVRGLLVKYKAEDRGGNYEIAKEDVADFNDEFGKIGEIEVEDPGVRFSLSELSNELRLSMKQIYPLMEFINEEE